MTDSDDRASAVTRSEERPEEAFVPEPPRLDVLADADAETLTFVSDPPGDHATTTAWITADADAVVDVSEMH
jgi:hypothetical protein